MQFSRIVALVPMRHHSQRVPQKNYRDMAGKPLFYYILNTLEACPEISAIAVDTDSEVIMEGLKADFPQVKIIERPAVLRADDIPMNDILLYDTSQVPADLYLQTHSTNPLLKPATISDAIKSFREQHEKYDSLFSATRLQTRLWDKYTKPINHDPDILLQTQDLPPVFEENSCIYLFTAEKLRERKNRIGEKPMMYEINADEAMDIDEERDFMIAEIIIKEKQKPQLV
ncbi:MAG: acylneuraminate cytidylyltransferase family protein [Anaerolineaceae bacterium]|nr:acylneuraminate cytidylyltransferase family protein [Anaerolineaceae bacterium]